MRPSAGMLFQYVVCDLSIRRNPVSISTQSPTFLQPCYLVSWHLSLVFLLILIRDRSWILCFSVVSGVGGEGTWTVRGYQPTVCPNFQQIWMKLRTYSYAEEQGHAIRSVHPYMLRPPPHTSLCTFTSFHAPQCTSPFSMQPSTPIRSLTFNNLIYITSPPIFYQSPPKKFTRSHNRSISWL